MNVDDAIVEALEEAGITFACWLPCSLLDGIIRRLEEHPEIRTVRVSREEEGVGICAGAALAGEKPALIMQNSGLGNSVNALCSLTLTYRLPLLMLMSHRGYLFEDIPAQVGMGKAAPKILENLNLHAFTIERPEELDVIPGAWKLAETAGEPVGVFLSPRLWRQTGR
ncbi:sulfopyruvate decarboxylase subunit alpha [Methanopyrus kandleri]|uniref:sulfopyruvate decarboxylase n=2 Tax=Methanopyrus kandleri TaxID=2320 RepID=Q8TYA7_METKA|nr:sulfopyruvate decarboxylase subunit alpha [Methanopyrus kandleri]AAM01610.1 Sulfopyruvate decarboxylase, alpha subunit [Methanopyrus kandleri AV19]HII70448.1 sulfopyruvate decarboxylase subunit alpha [Methanopyrus kandleri]